MAFVIDDDTPTGRFVIEDGPAPPKGPPMSRMEKYATGLADPIHGGAQLLTNALPAGFVQAGNRFNNWLADRTGLVARLPEGGVDQQVREREAQYEQMRAAAGESGLDGYRLLGNITSPTNLAIASRAPAAVSTGGKILTGMIGGGASSAMNPVTGQADYWDEKQQQVRTGVIAGGAVPGATAATARLISPKASTNANVQLLRQEGVTPTVGQALGGRWNVAEEKLMSVPILGDFIANARGRSLEQFNNAAVNRATAPIGVKVQGAGQQAIKEAGDALSKAYDDALNNVKFVQFDPQFMGSLAQLKQMGSSLVTGGMHGGPREKFAATVKNIVIDRMGPNGTMLPETFKKVDSELGQIAARYSKSSLASEQELGQALTQMQALVKQQMLRSNPQVAQSLAKTDKGWANLVRIEQAGKSGKNAEGMFTPGQLNMAIANKDQSVRGRAVARGTALMQDLGNAGQQVLGNKVPNSFTTDRALLAGASGTGAGYFLDPMVPMGLLAAGAMYTKPMQGLLSGAVSARPQGAQAFADAVRKSSPMLIPLGAQVGLGLLN